MFSEPVSSVSRESGHWLTMPSRRRVLSAGAALAVGALITPAAPVFAEKGDTPAMPVTLDTSVKGVLQGTTGGAFAFYEHTHVDGTPQRISLSYLPFDATQGHRIGFAVYQQGVKLGQATGTATGLGDKVTSNKPSLIFTPSAGKGPLLIQVFVYSPEIVIYTLSISSPSAPSGAPISGPLELDGSTGGLLPSNSGGAFATYQISRPTGARLTLTLAYGPFDAGYAHSVGLEVFQAGRRLGSATSLATGLGDSINRDVAILTVTPAAAAGPVTIRLFSYSSFDLNYTLLAS